MSDISTTNLIDSIVVGTQRNVFTLPYAECETAAATAAKTVTCDNFVLTTGAMIAVKFMNAHTTSSMTLNVNNTGAKNVYYNGANVYSGLVTRLNVYTFIYDGTYFRILGVNTNTDTKVSSTNSDSKLFLVGTTTQTSAGQTGYSNSSCYASGGALYSEGTKVALVGHTHTYSEVGAASSAHTHSNYASSSHTHTSQNYAVNYGTCSTASGTAAKTVTITGIGTTPSAGTRITVRFSQANNAATPTLSVNGSANRSIKSPSSSFKWCAGAIIDFVYYSAAWYMMSPTPTAYYTTTEINTGITGSGVTPS